LSSPEQFLSLMRGISAPPPTPRLAIKEAKEKDIDFEEVESKEAVVPSPLKTMVRGLFRGRTIRVRMGNGFSFTTTGGTGAINVSCSVSAALGAAEMASWTNLFDEFFVHSMTLHYEPIGEFIGFQSLAVATQIASTQLYVVSLYHGSAAYAAASPAVAMLNNGTLKICSSGRPWKYVWRNNEDPRVGVAEVSTTSSPPVSQGWCLTQNASAYAGVIQTQAYSGVGAVAGGVQFGVAAGILDISFRARA